MSNTFGKLLTVTLFGESHGAMMGITLDGLPAGWLIDQAFITQQLTARQGVAAINTTRQELNHFRIISGLYLGKTTGGPLTIIIENNDQNSKDYAPVTTQVRPGHADLTAYYKYHGFNDPRGGGMFSGRLTSLIVAAGAICQQLLKSKHILIGSHLASALGYQDRYHPMDLPQLIMEHQHDPFCVYDAQVKQQLLLRLEQLHALQDSAGAIVESFVLNLPLGVGEPWFDSLESTLAHGLLAIPGIKGVEFGAGFQFAQMTGSVANDLWSWQQGQPQTTTNHNGGINGGISNGMPLIIRSVVKPTPSIGKPQSTINVQTKETTTLTINGRHDTFVANRALIVINNMIAINLLDQCLCCFGKDWLCLD